MFTNEMILKVAMRQSAIDNGCGAEDFLKTDSVIADFKIGQGARVYFKEPVACNFISYGNNVVAAVKPEIRDIVTEYVQKNIFYHLFSTPSLLWLNEHIAEKGFRVRHMAYYFLPDMEKLKALPCQYATKLLYPKDFEKLYTDAWSNALCAQRKECDRLAIGAYDGDTLIGLAGCSADCEDMWQIGIDVLPSYRKQGIASALTSQLAVEIVKRGKVPFYCCAWGNIPSARNAVKSGFVPSWAEMTVKPAENENNA